MRHFPWCARERLKLCKDVGELKRFPATATNESVFIDILGKLCRTPRGHRYVLVITNHFTNMTRTVHMKDVAAEKFDKCFDDNWVFNYGPPTDFMYGNTKQFTFKLFLDYCGILNVYNSLTTILHRQMNGEGERLNRIILATMLGKNQRLSQERESLLFSDIRL